MRRDARRGRLTRDAHAAPHQAAYVAARTAWLEERGYSVIRFGVGEAARNLACVVKSIRAACEARPADVE